MELGVLDGGPGIDDMWVRLAGRSARGTAVVPQGLHEVVVHVSGEHSVLSRKKSKEKKRKKEKEKKEKRKKNQGAIDSRRQKTVCKRVAKGNNLQTCHKGPAHRRSDVGVCEQGHD